MSQRSIIFIIAVFALMLLVAVGWAFNPGTAKTHISIEAPASDIILTEGASTTIRWTSENVPAGYKVAISIRRIPPPPLQEEGQEFDPLVVTDIPNSGNYEWKVSEMYPPGNYVLGISAYEKTPVTNPVSSESGPLTIIPALSADLAPLYSAAAWSKPALYPLDIPNGPLYGTAVMATATVGTMDPSKAFSPFDEYYSNKLRSLGWKVDQSLLANGPASQQMIYRKDGQLIAVNFNTVFHARSETAPSQCPCDVHLVLFSTKN